MFFKPHENPFTVYNRSVSGKNTEYSDKTTAYQQEPPVPVPASCRVSLYTFPGTFVPVKLSFTGNSFYFWEIRPHEVWKR